MEHGDPGSKAVFSRVPLLNSRAKSRELQSRLEGDRLATAREHLDDLYVPLNQAVAQVRTSYRQLQERDAGERAPGEEKFREACAKFLAFADAIEQKGHSILLTAPLDTALQDFSEFLRASLTATEPRTRILLRVVSARVPVGDVRGALFAGGAFRTVYRALGWVTPWMALEVKEVVAAPPSSQPFGARFLADVEVITELIRDVSLARTSGST
jgi:hypothetical protein